MLERSKCTTYRLVGTGVPRAMPEKPSNVHVPMRPMLISKTNASGGKTPILPPSQKEPPLLHAHLLQLPTDSKRRLRLRPNLLHTDTFCILLQRQPLYAVDVKHRQIRNNGRYALLARERETAVVENLGVTLFVHVFHGDDDFGLGRVGDEIHGAADALDFTREHEVCEVWSGACEIGVSDGGWGG